MLKIDLISAIASKIEGATKIQVRAFLDAMSIVAGDALVEEGEFVLPGFMKVVLSDVPAKPERMVRNPATGSLMKAPPKAASHKLKVRFLRAIKVKVGQIDPIPPKSKKVSAKKSSK